MFRKGPVTDINYQHARLWDKFPQVVDVTTLKMARKPVKLQKENPAGCAGEGKQRIGNIGEEKRTVDYLKMISMLTNAYR